MLFEIAVISLLALIIALQLASRRQTTRQTADLVSQTQAANKSFARLFSQIEAYLSLRDRLGLRQGLPYSHNWSASPDFLKLIVNHALSAKPATIVECSSGLTTLMLAKCCEMNGWGQVFSLENGAEFAAKSRSEIERYELAGYATVIDAPLVEHTVEGQIFRWYALEHLINRLNDQPAERQIDMLVIDGPPGFLQRHSRYPALPLLFDRLAPNGIVFLDDAARPDEREITTMWQARFPALQHEFIETERGCAVLRVKPASQHG